MVVRFIFELTYDIISENFLKNLPEIKINFAILKTHGIVLANILVLFRKNGKY